MRSRYSAFAVGEAGHLLASWAQETRPRRLVLDGGERWLRLRVLGASHAPGSDTALVEFVAVSERAGVRSRLHELSRFVRRGGRWFYLDGGIDPS
ncbi:YchJ family protein [Mycetocola reblochoni]